MIAVCDHKCAGGHDVRVPTAPLHPYLQVPRPFVLAHRGLATCAPENTMAAFEAAVAAGVTHLETDVHATLDGVLVAFHDPTLDRLTHLTGRVATLSWPQLRDAGLRGGDRMPLLADLLAAWPHIRINVDLKSDAAVLPFVELLRRTRSTDRICVASFSDRRRRVAVRALTGTGPVASSLGVGSSTRLVALAAGGAPPGVLRRVLAGAVAVQLPDRAGPVPVVTRRLVRGVHAAGAQVHVWTVDDPARMRELIGVGVDAIVTNRADLAMPIVAAGGGPSGGRR
jgi:glycerophosphoryl diester phosphodiesterase